MYMTALALQYILVIVFICMCMNECLHIESISWSRFNYGSYGDFRPNCDIPESFLTLHTKYRSTMYPTL